MSLSGCRIAVTGGTGYVGSAMLSGLLESGAEVLLLVRAGSMTRELSRGGIEVVEIDQSTAATVQTIVDWQPDGMLHLAAYGGASTPPDEFIDVVDSIIVLGSILLEAAARSAHRVVPVVAAGSFWQRAGTGEQVHPNSFYAGAKAGLEQIAQYFCAERNVSATFLHLTDVYGAHDPRGRLITALARAGLAGTPLKMSGGEQPVSFVHIADVVRAFQHVLARSIADDRAGFRVYSVFGPSIAPLRVTVEQLSDRLSLAIPVIWGAREYRPNEVMEAHLSEPPPGWEPQIPLEQGFQLLLESLS